MSGTRIKVLFPIDENVPMNKCYEATSNESMYNASTLDVLEDEAEKGHTLRDCLHSGMVHCAMNAASALTSRFTANTKRLGKK